MYQCAGEGMFGEKQNYFKNGRIDQAALVSFIKDIKKNTKLSDEDAAVIAASKVGERWEPVERNQQVKYPVFQIVDSQPKSRMWYRIGATRNLTGGRKIMPSLRMNDQVRQVSGLWPAWPGEIPSYQASFYVKVFSNFSVMTLSNFRESN